MIDTYSSYKWTFSNRRYKTGYIPKEPIQLYDTLEECRNNVIITKPKKLYIYQVCDYHFHKQYIGSIQYRHTLKEVDRVLSLKQLWLPLSNDQVEGNYCKHFVRDSKELENCEIYDVTFYPTGHKFAQVDKNGKIIQIIHSSQKERIVKISKL